MTRLLAMALVGALFVIGVLVGALGTHLYNAHASGGREFSGFRGTPGPPDRRIEQLVEHLELTEDQRVQVVELIEGAHEEAERMRLEMEPRVHEHMRRTHEAIREVLTPEQRERFREFHKRHRAWAHRFFLGQSRRHGKTPPHPAHP